MKRLHLFVSLALCAALLSTLAPAKTPKDAALNKSPRALTPPPKEWAMFPDEPPPPTPPQPQPPPNPAGQPPQASQPLPGATAAAPSGIVSAAVLPAAPKHDLPLLWIALTGLLSFGALAACGGLILKKESPDSDSRPAVIKTVAGIPVVDDVQEIR